jgi:arylsulfatase A-like enzyme
MRKLVLLLLALLLAACPSAQDPLERRPNVVLLVADTTRADMLSAYGHRKPTSINLERLASEGVLFERAFTTDFWTIPSHASLLTGLYPSEHQATSLTNHLPESADTLAERLASAGYVTQGYVVNPWISAERGYGQGFQGYTHVGTAAASSTDWSHPDERAMDQAVTFVRRQAKQAEPFFLFINLNRAHLPSNPDAGVLVELTPEARPMSRVVRLRNFVGGWGIIGGIADFDDLDFQIMREFYEAEVAMVDADIGELIDALDEAGILDDTLFIVTADHGENIGERGMLDHILSMHDTTIRVPLIIRYPSRFPAGTVETDLVSRVDVFPSVLDVSGVARDDSEILARGLANPERQARAFVIAENERPINGISLLKQAFPSFDTSDIDHPIRMIRGERYKLIWRPNGDVQLFDLLADPGERNDLSAERPEVLDRMESQLLTWMAEHETTETPAPFESQDLEAQDELRALGYIE